MINLIRIACMVVFSLAIGTAMSQEHIELGDVNWLRDLDQAQARAQKQDKPIFMLFQEVPGCATCQNFGLQVLAHPLIVEAIETYFVPLAIFNNHGGSDAKVLAAYQEPTWNNPVVRFINHRGGNLVKRHAGDYSAVGLVTQIIQVMEKDGTTIPEYLTLLNEELAAEQRPMAEATFGMFCFWTGEKAFGQLDGVLHTEAGFIGGREVVEVVYDPAEIGFDELVKQGKEQKCADRYYYENQEQQQAAVKIFGNERLMKKGKYRADREVHYYLHHSRYSQIPMSPIQRTKANAMLGNRQDPTSLFSPRQLSFLDKKEVEKRYLSEKWKDILTSSI